MQKMAWSQSASEADAEPCFELYHENSKIGRRVRPLPLLRPGSHAGEDIDGDQYPLFTVGEASPVAIPIGVALGRAPVAPQTGRLTMKVLASLLSSYAVADAD